jgi:hypothetical protein
MRVTPNHTPRVEQDSGPLLRISRGHSIWDLPVRTERTIILDLCLPFGALV